MIKCEHNKALKKQTKLKDNQNSRALLIMYVNKVLTQRKNKNTVAVGTKNHKKKKKTWIPKVSCGKIKRVKK